MRFKVEIVSATRYQTTKYYVIDRTLGVLAGTRIAEFFDDWTGLLQGTGDVNRTAQKNAEDYAAWRNSQEKEN